MIVLQSRTSSVQHCPSCTHSYCVPLSTSFPLIVYPQMISLQPQCFLASVHPWYEVVEGVHIPQLRLGRVLLRVLQVFEQWQNPYPTYHDYHPQRRKKRKNAQPPPSILPYYDIFSISPYFHTPCFRSTAFLQGILFSTFWWQPSES